VSNDRSWARSWNGFGYHRERRALLGIEHAPRIEFDSDAKHVIVEQQILKLSHAAYE
jgi:hypothetical protein